MPPVTLREHALLTLAPSPSATRTYAVSEAAKLAALDPHAHEQALAEARGLPPKAARQYAKLQSYLDTYVGTYGSPAGGA